MLNKTESKIIKEDIYDDLREFWHDTSNDKISKYFTKEEIKKLRMIAKEQDKTFKELLRSLLK